eukprot:scaffold205217_cov27-Tisochrysis_lutea.AAC.4
MDGLWTVMPYEKLAVAGPRPFPFLSLTTRLAATPTPLVLYLGAQVVAGVWVERGAPASSGIFSHDVGTKKEGGDHGRAARAHNHKGRGARGALELGRRGEDGGVAFILNDAISRLLSPGSSPCGHTPVCRLSLVRSRIHVSSFSFRVILTHGSQEVACRLLYSCLRLSGYLVKACFASCKAGHFSWVPVLCLGLELSLSSRPVLPKFCSACSLVKPLAIG